MLPDFWKSSLKVSQASLICPSGNSNTGEGECDTDSGKPIGEWGSAD